MRITFWECIIKLQNPSIELAEIFKVLDMKTTYKHYSPLRNNRGAAVIGLCLGLSTLLLFIGFFVFDMNQLQMAQRQLTAISDAASLAGTAMLTSKDVSYEDATLDTLYTTQIAAENFAANMFAMGNILGKHLYNRAASGAQPNGIEIIAVNSYPNLANPAAGTVKLLVRLCAPISNYTVVAPGTSNGRAIYVQANYAYVPLLSGLGVTSVPIPSNSIGGLQKLAVIMVFDCSGSMDDNTVVTFVERRWTTPIAIGNYPADSAAAAGANGNRGQYSYDVVGSPGSGAAAGQLWQYSGLDYVNEPNGTALNVLPPQNLDYLGYIYANVHTNYANSNVAFDQVSPPLAFDYAIRDYVCWPAGIAGTPNSVNTCYPNNGALGFQGPYYDNDFGTPPGNCPVKYGFGTPSASGGIYGVTAGSTAATSVQSMNIWDNTSAHAPGPGNSPGYRYYVPPNNPANAAPNNTHDGNLYFYDPYSIPTLYSGNAYTPFTDLVANITPVNYTTAGSTITPPTQPLYGTSPFTFSGGTYKFSGSSYTVSFAESATANNISTAAVNFEQDSWTGSNYYLKNRTFKFSSIAYLVEASRGNLDLDNNGKPTNYVNALLSFGNRNGIAQPAQSDCAYGYQKAYQRLAMYCSQPYATAIDGANRFFQNLAGTSSSIFGFVGFSVAPGVTTNYNCAYQKPSVVGYYSLALGAPAGASKSTHTAVYSSYVFEPKAGTNPNFWVTHPFASTTSGAQAYSGPAGGDANTGAGIAYNSAYNTSPSTASWIYTLNSNVNHPSNSATMFAFNNPGFQIPRFALMGTSDSVKGGQGQQASFWGVTGPAWYGYRTDTTGNSNTWGMGCNGLYHCRPLYDTMSLEALTVALDNLTSISALNTQTGLTTNLTLPTLGPGTKKAIVFFTDGVPTDDSGTFSSYISNIVTPAASKGIAIYSIGLSLNSSVKVTQSTFLQALSNNGACGSQYFQVINSASLNSTFTGIARQLSQCQR